MARTKADLSQWVRLLEEKLKAAKRGQIVGAEDMAAILGMTWANLRKTYVNADPAFPCLRGAEGRSYEFDVQKVLRHLIARAKAQMAERDRHNASIARIAGISLPEQEGTLSLAEQRQMLDITLKVQEQKRDQGGFLAAGEVRKFLIGYNQTVRDMLIGSGAVIDPTGDLDPARRAAFDDQMRDICLAVQARLDRFIKDYHAGSLPG